MGWKNVLCLILTVWFLLATAISGAAGFIPGLFVFSALMVVSMVGAIFLG